jgi:hypothetical protein
MTPELLKFEGDFKSKVNLVRVNVRKPDSQEYKDYMKFFKSRYVPFVVLLDQEQKVLDSHTGVMKETDLEKFVSSHVK